jgi:hypothetical protein
MMTRAGNIADSNTGNHRMAESTSAGLKLNLGSGQNPVPGFINVDKFGSPDVKWDLEVFPWPWPDNSVEQILLVHVLEHLGETIQGYFGIIKELYRVSRHGASIRIVVPHPRHDDFLGDPTHVRPFTPESFHLYSKEANRKWQEARFANSPLGLYLDVDFTVAAMRLDLERPYAEQLQAGKLTQEQVGQLARVQNNVIKQIQVQWIVNKPDQAHQ